MEDQSRRSEIDMNKGCMLYSLIEKKGENCYHCGTVEKVMKIAVAGTGYVGLVTGVAWRMQVIMLHV